MKTQCDGERLKIQVSVSQLRRSLSRYSSLRRKYPQAKSVVTDHITDRTTHNASMLPLPQTATCIIKANRNFHSTCLNIIVLHTSILTDIKRKTFWENRNTSENRIKKKGELTSHLKVQKDKKPLCSGFV